MKLFLVAGEPSGDRLGAALIAGLKTLAPDIRFEGVGGPLMQAEGLQSLFAMDELSVMGIVEVLPKYRALHARMVQTARAAIAARPDALITIDSPDFCLKVAARAKAGGLRCVHYVAPSVWAWRPGRATRMARHVDQVLALLPFEPPLMEAAGMRCDFVGHPVVALPRPDASEVTAFRAELGGAPVIVVLPGSRASEVARLGPIFGAALRDPLTVHPDARVIVPAAASVSAAVRAAVATWPGEPRIIDQGALSPAEGERRKMLAFASGDVALAASGTVSLELAAAGTPMVVAYDMGWLSWQIMSRMALIDTVTLVNLVTDTRVVPEFLGPACRPAPIAASLLEVLSAPQRQSAALAQTMEALGQGGEAPGLRAARAVLDGLRPA